MAAVYTNSTLKAARDLPYGMCYSRPPEQGLAAKGARLARNNLHRKADEVYIGTCRISY